MITSASLPLPLGEGWGEGPRATTLVVAALSARTVAESAAQAGWRVIALDVFGDLDTRRASARWAPIGDATTLVIDPQRLHAALAEAAEQPGVIGWVAGSGFEAAPALLDAGPASLPRFGMPSDAVCALRDPRHFFATLDRLGLAHPQVAFELPADPAGWLVKRSGGTGGWHIRAVASGAVNGDTNGTNGGTLHSDSYFQRVQGGTPMSALFLADGRSARLVALNQLTVAALGRHPHVYRGAMGPILDAPLQQHIESALAQLVPAFALQGLASLDFIAENGVPLLLEINPRPSASMALHNDAWPSGLMWAHVEAVQGHLPATAARHPPGLRGNEVLFARRHCRVSAALAAQLAATPGCHDLPQVSAAAGMAFAPGDPVCSVSAQGETLSAVQQALAQRLAEIAAQLEPTTTMQEMPPCPP